MLFQVHDRTRDDTFSTDNEANALRFTLEYSMRHPTHVIEVWRQKIDGKWEMLGD